MLVLIGGPHTVSAIPYSEAMMDSRVADRRRRRGEYLKQRFAADRWSARQVSLRTGMKSSTMATRLSGETELLFEDIVAIAEVLGVEPQALFAELLEASEAAEPEEAPAESAPSDRELVALNVAAELARQRWSYRKAADELGVSAMYISRRISGDTGFTVEDLRALARLLDVPVSRFFDGA